MGIFSFLKNKKKENQAISINILFLEKLKLKIEEHGFEVKHSANYVALVLHNEIEIATAIIPGEFHPSMLPIISTITHKEHFPDGINDNFVGIGETIQAKIDSAIQNFFTGSLNTLLDSLSDMHHSEADFTVTMDNKDILWHPFLSDEIFQGPRDLPEHTIPLYNLILMELTSNLKNTKFNWLKMYVAKLNNNDIQIECSLNNETWEKGAEILMNYAKTWNLIADFQSQKQFVIFRRCDIHDRNN